ncbi:MAG: hypothetical protein JO287_19625 [Pseudonocardiales bacterium]|nr:hypothetical protein [Pseudonocardiales bacterium]
MSSNVTVLGVARAPAAGSASAILGGCMFAGGIVVSPVLSVSTANPGGADGRGGRGRGAGGAARYRHPYPWRPSGHA